MRKTIAILMGLVVFAALLSAMAGRDRKDIDQPPAVIPFRVPPGFPAPAWDFSRNPLTRQGVALGRKLFYEGRLSRDGNFPCSSCHQQFAAFSTFEHDFSHGFDNRFTTRNAPGLFNLAWQKNFHWDGGINHLELQPLAPLTAPNEMAEDLNNVIRKMKADTAYPRLFKAAFGDPAINSQRMLKALAQFMLTLVSADAKYDRMKRGEADFTKEEQEGYAIFKSKCAACHTEPLFTDMQYRNNGLALHPQLKDYGRMVITGLAADSLKFKVPSLRNLYLTYPYMHDGRYYTLDQVLNHYATKVAPGPTLDPLLAKGIDLSALERYRLKAFLRTLTDSAFARDSRFSQPQ